MKLKLFDIFEGHKFLISKSKAYPLLSFYDMTEWLSELELLESKDLTRAQFDRIFRECKQFSLKRTTTIVSPLKKKPIKKQFGYKKKVDTYVEP